LNYLRITILWHHRRIGGPSLTETSLCGAYMYNYTGRRHKAFEILCMKM